MDAKTIGERLWTLRGNRTRKEVCEATNITISALANYEHGYRIPRDRAKVALSEYYGVGISELFYLPTNYTVSAVTTRER